MTQISLTRIPVHNRNFDQQDFFQEPKVALCKGPLYLLSLQELCCESSKELGKYIILKLFRVYLVAKLKALVATTNYYFSIRKEKAINLSGQSISSHRFVIPI